MKKKIDIIKISSKCIVKALIFENMSKKKTNKKHHKSFLPQNDTSTEISKSFFLINVSTYF